MRDDFISLLISIIFISVITHFLTSAFRSGRIRERGGSFSYRDKDPFSFWLVIVAFFVGLATMISVAFAAVVDLVRRL